MSKKLQAPKWRGWILIAISAIGIGVLVGVVAGVVLIPHPIAKIGRNVTGIGYRINIESMRVDTVGSEPFVPGPDGEFVIVTLALTNTSKQKVSFAPVIQTYIRDSKGTTFQMAPAAVNNPLAAGDIAPGKTVRGELSYWVDRATVAPVFHFDPSWTSQASPAAIALY